MSDGRGSTAEAGTDRPGQARGRRGPFGTLSMLLALLAVVLTIVSIVQLPLATAQLRPLLVLLVLGAVSATTLDYYDGVGYSFTSFVLASTLPLLGPTGAALVGCVIPLLDKSKRWTVVHLFNTALIVIMGVTSGFAYTLCGGQLPIQPDQTGPSELALHVGLPLLVADIVGMVVNAVLLAVTIRIRGGNARLVLAGAVRQTAPLYLGYTVLAFLFVTLWAPGRLWELSAVLIMVPLLIARWSYRQYGEELKAHSRILDTLVIAGDGWDRGGSGHGYRVGQYAQLMAEDLGLGFGEQRDLRYASVLHDVGRLGTPRAVLETPAEVRDQAARELIFRHPLLAAEIIGGIEFMSDAARAIRHHHERLDGLGYPDGLVGDEIPLIARVIAVADAFDALTTSTGSRRLLEVDEAVEELRRGAGTQFDPRCVEALARISDRTRDDVDRARRQHDDGAWRDHDDPRLGHLMLARTPGASPPPDRVDGT